MKTAISLTLAVGMAFAQSREATGFCALTVTLLGDKSELGSMTLRLLRNGTVYREFAASESVRICDLPIEGELALEVRGPYVMTTRVLGVKNMFPESTSFSIQVPRPPASVEGQYVPAARLVRVTDPKGQPLQGATAVLLDKTREVATARTNEVGLALLTDLRLYGIETAIPTPKSYQVRVHKEGFTPVVVEVGPRGNSEIVLTTQPPR